MNKPSINTPSVKKTIIKAGDAAAQITELSIEIKKLTSHLQTNPKDFSSRRGLLKKVGNRKSLLRYLQTTKPASYKKVVAENGLRG